MQWEGREELEGVVEGKERVGRGADVKNEEGEERHGCWVIDAPGDRCKGTPNALNLLSTLIDLFLLL